MAADPDTDYYDSELEQDQEYARDRSQSENLYTVLQFVYDGLENPEDAEDWCNDRGINVDSILPPFGEYLDTLVNYRYPNPSVYYRFYLFKRDLISKAVQLLTLADHPVPVRDEAYVRRVVMPCVSDIAAYYFEDY
jgi:hypothetical protein